MGQSDNQTMGQSGIVQSAISPKRRMRGRPYIDVLTGLPDLVFLRGWRLDWGVGTGRRPRPLGMEGEKECAPFHHASRVCGRSRDHGCFAVRQHREDMARFPSAGANLKNPRCGHSSEGLVTRDSADWGIFKNRETREICGSSNDAPARHRKMRPPPARTGGG